jgi:hypothetical protein
MQAVYVAPISIDRNLNRWYIFNVSVQRRFLMNTHRLVAAIYYYDGASIEA